MNYQDIALHFFRGRHKFSFSSDAPLIVYSKDTGI